MSHLLWSNDDYSVHIPAIDNEHKLLVCTINEFGDTLQLDGSLHAQIISEKLAYLSQFIRKHFESEERFLLFNNYPEYTEHLTEHTLLLERLSSFESRFKAENKAFNERMLTFLIDWLIRHVILHDRKYATYYQNKELIDHSNTNTY
jgi:hemerythrin